MLRDLLGQGTGSARDADVLVVGAGVAGLAVATRLARAGLRVLVMESGGARQDADTHPLNEVVHVGAEYRGAAHGRFRCLGGTSTRWGGAMIPFVPGDMAGGGARRWPLRLAELAAYQGEVERLFGLPEGAYDRPDLVATAGDAAPTHVPRLAKWPAFRRRNVARLFEPDIRGAAGPEVWLNATLTDLAIEADGRVAGAEAGAPDGSRLRVTARAVVVAAGAIESTRILLLADRRRGGRLFAPHDVLGRYFHDHLSACVGTVVPRDRRALNRLASFRFEGGGMRNLRFEPDDRPEVRAVLPAGFAHLVVASPPGGGFDHLRDLYRQLQMRRPPRAGTLLGLGRALPWLARAAWWRQRERRLLYPDEATLELHMVIEQEPRAENRITLSGSRADAFGQPLAVLDWTVADADKANLAAATQAFAAYWSRSSLARLADLRLRDGAEAQAALAEGGGIYHPGGSTRMGAGPGGAVVDSDLRTFAVPGLTVLATSTFPSGGGANPTMMLLMFALRVADRLAADLGRRA